MLAKRIIPCLDVAEGKVVKGVNFLNVREVGDPVDCAMAYDRQGADEITFLDIMASHEGRGTMLDVVRRTAERVFVPLTVGGGIRTADDFRDLLRAGIGQFSRVKGPRAAVQGGRPVRQPVRGAGDRRQTQPGGRLCRHDSWRPGGTGPECGRLGDRGGTTGRRRDFAQFHGRGRHEKRL